VKKWYDDEPPVFHVKPAHPVLRVPGWKGEIWDAEIGRWVISRTKNGGESGDTVIEVKSVKARKRPPKKIRRK